MYHDASPGLANYSTAVNTRSLVIIPLSESVVPNSSYINQAILYYENPNGDVSALLQRRVSAEYQWVDMTSQESQSLPHDCRNLPNNGSSHTLYESEGAAISTPFTPSWAGTNPSADKIGHSTRATVYTSANSTSAWFYSPEMEHFVVKEYDVLSTGCGDFILSIH